jgi:type II secretion system protein N
MSPRVRRALTYAGLSAFYSLMLLIFCVATFPYQRLRDRLVDEFNARQTGPDPLRLELDELSGYWLGGLEAEGIRLISAPKPPSTTDASAEPPKPSVLSIESAHARASLFGLLFGSLDLSFGADAFGGVISGDTSESDGTRALELTLEDLSLAKMPLLSDAIGLPLAGTVQGTLDLSLPEGKLSKADGTVSLDIVGLSAGDGKAKIRDTIALPTIEAGDLKVVGDISEGQLKFTDFSSKGPDLELVAEGSLRLRDPLPTSLLSLTARFRFTDRYASKNDLTKALLGTPGSTAPGLFDLDPKNKRAKRADGFYGYRVSGALSAPTFLPNPTGASATGSKTKPAE